MIDTLLALVPLYGLFLVAGVVAVSCLAVPLPSSMLVMASGGFAAAGDLVLWQVIAVAFVAYVVGDQVAFYLGRWGGQTVTDRLRASSRRAPLVDRAEALVDRWGTAAILASRTVISPLGPSVSYICGAARMRRMRFTLAAVAGAALWSAGYSLIGYGFAERLDDLAGVIWNEGGFIMAGAVAVASGWWLWRGWRAHRLAARTIPCPSTDAPAKTADVPVSR